MWSSCATAAATARNLASRREIFAALLLVAVTVAVFEPVTGFDFVDFDDPGYVSENPFVRRGFSPGGLAWALTAEHEATWQPVTWISLMLDAELFGPAPGAFHRTNLILHCLNVLLLFAALRWMTGSTTRSAVVAALFAVHPLRAESVAWITERKDVLSFFFGMLALLAWIRHVRTGRRRDTVLAAVALAVGLLAKPVLVTLPLLFLLLDVWPLRRTRDRSAASLVSEKLPLFAIVAASSVVTFLVQSRHGAVTAVRVVSVGDRLGNAVVSYVRYLGKLVWPRDLSPLYPHPNMAGGTPWGWGQVAGALVLLVAISWLVFRHRDRAYLPVGWLWFLVALLPMIGLVQVGSHAMADRFTYLPSIGILLAVVWWVGDVGAGRAPRLAGTAAVTVVAALAVAAARQVTVWRDSVTLTEHAIAVGAASPKMFHNLGLAYAREGRLEEAIPPLEEAVRLKPDHARAWNNLGRTRRELGDLDGAIAAFRRALEIDGENARFWSNLGAALTRAGRDAEALDAARRAAELDPGNAAAHNDLGILLAREGRLVEAIEQFARAVEIDPGFVDAGENLSRARRMRDAEPR